MTEKLEQLAGNRDPGANEALRMDTAFGNWRYAKRGARRGSPG